MFTGTDHTWDELAFLREHWDGPILLKGIQTADDARRAVDAGMAGVIVSNHGGRQVDGAIASLDALPAIADAVGRAGRRRCSTRASAPASDVVKALALGAKAVFVGRPWVYGLGLGGTDGVRHVLRSLLADLDLDLALSGSPHARATLDPATACVRPPGEPSAGGSSCWVRPARSGRRRWT